MSARPRERDIEQEYNSRHKIDADPSLEKFTSSKVNLNDLIKKMKKSRAEEKKSNLVLSAAAVSAVALFGIILTL